MKLGQQIPRNALVWMIMSVFTLAAPHLGRIPPWVIVVYIVAAVWRIMVYRGSWSFPGRLVKGVLILGACSGIYLSFGTLIGLEPTVALLLTAFAFKLIELASHKDAYVLLFLGYFICLTAFLFDQSLPVVLYSLLNVWLVTTALLALHQPGEHEFNQRSLRQAGVMILQAMPLMLVLFLLFPRFGPLWKVPLKSQAAKTGVSDFMRPGDISDLSQSDEVAFRVQFSAGIPNTAQLYWRGLVFSKLEQGTWRSLRYGEIPAGEHRPRPVELTGASTEYSIIMEPTQQNWLYSLRYARAVSSGLMETADYRLYNMVELEDEYQYRVRSWPRVKLETDLSPWRHELESSLPGTDNPRTRELAATLRESAPNDKTLVRTALRVFREEPYVYTLQPARLLGENRVDQFLFDTRQGFCEHYASAFVVLMRAAGVPARVVAGYQGGEVNPVNRTVIVHQFDAHAWAEVWLPGEGWVRVDPTAQVSPERIEWGLEQAVSREGSFLSDSPLSPLRFRGISWVNNVRLQYDALTFQWQKWVIGFNGEQQFEFLQRFMGRASARKFAMIILGSFALVLIPVALVLLFRRPTRQLGPLQRDYLVFCDRLEQKGVGRLPGETPDAFAARAAEEMPDIAAQVRKVTRMYNQLAYSAGLDPLRRQAIQREFRQAARRIGRREARGIV
jgi:transglutaminase-like putative cysteine protease